MRYCVIGTPVAHSKSPDIFARIFVDRQLDHTYDICEIRTQEQLTAFFEGMKQGERAGCNVTMPWKTLAVSYMDELTDEARLMNAVNTVRCDNGRLIGHSTDGAGMLAGIAHVLNMRDITDKADTDGGCTDCSTAVVKNMTVCILGSGGAARSVIAAACLAGAGMISVISRKGNNLELVRSLVSRLEDMGRSPKLRLIGWDDADKVQTAISEAELLVNCTPIGMSPDVEGLPIRDVSLLRPGMIVADAIYEPRETKLIRIAAERGCITVPGMEMLEGQAIAGAGFFGML